MLTFRHLSQEVCPSCVNLGGQFVSGTNTGEHCVWHAAEHLGGAEEVMNIWWVYATDDSHQHGCTSVPPRKGGTFQSLCEHDYIAPPGKENTHRTQGVKPFCDRCLMEYCLVPCPAPVWTY